MAVFRRRCWLICLTAWPVLALGHIAGTTTTTIQVAQEGISILYTVPADSLADLRAGAGGAVTVRPPRAYFDDVRRVFEVRNDAQRCAIRIERFRILQQTGGYRYWLLARCATRLRQIEIDYRLMVDRLDGHENFVDVQAGRAQQNVTLSRQRTRITVPVDELVGHGVRLPAQLPSDVAPSPPAMPFLRAGIEHIFRGADHIAFLVALLLITSTFVQLAWLVSAFTVGHSITLALAALGLVTVNLRLVEALIALSIVVVALGNVWVLARRRTEARPRRPGRWLLVLVFGLMHGLGFSAVLGEIGLPAEKLVAALVLFNLGIEIGQLAIVGLVLAVLVALWQVLPYRATSMVLSLAVGTAGAFWLIERVPL